MYSGGAAGVSDVGLATAAAIEAWREETIQRYRGTTTDEPDEPDGRRHRGRHDAAMQAFQLVVARAEAAFTASAQRAAVARAAGLGSPPDQGR
jgi:hypothetical protein